MAVAQDAGARYPTHNRAAETLAGRSLILPGVEVMRERRVEPFFTRASDAFERRRAVVRVRARRLFGACLRDSATRARRAFCPRRVAGLGKYEVRTRGKTLQFGAKPGTTSILPRRPVDELKWEGPTHRTAVALHPCLLVSALDETAYESDIELTEHWI
jgi:hypothetical protein